MATLTRINAVDGLAGMFSICTSALSTRRSRTLRPAVDFRSRDSDFLFRCKCWKSLPCLLPPNDCPAAGSRPRDGQVDDTDVAKRKLHALHALHAL